MQAKRAAAALLSCTLLFVPYATPATASKVSSPYELALRADNLKPGEWVWAPQISPAGPVLIYVDLSRQLATVYRNGIRIGVSTISSGMASHATPTGVFTILQKHIDHKSNIYNNAPMPYMQRLTWDGVALHAGANPGFPASHGCIRLPTAFAKKLFEITQLGATVEVTDEAYVSGMDAPVYTPAAVSRDHEVGETARANEREGIAQAMRAD